MKSINPIQVNDIRLQVDHISPKKIQLLEEYRNDPGNARIFVILIRHRQIEMISDENIIFETKVI